MGFNLGQFVIGAGTGYLKGENDNRDRARQDTRDAQDKELFDSRMRLDRMQEEDMVATRADRQTLRTAAKPIVPEENGSGGMVRPPEMDNRDVGLPENASLPNQGLSSARYKVAGKDYGTRSEADAAAAPMNTPEASAKRYATAQTGLGDFKGAQQTMAELEKAKRDQRSVAADAMMNEIGKGFMTGGWQGGTEVLSRSGADGNDYRSEIDPVSGKVRMHQTQRDTGKTRVLGEFTNDNSGMLDAYKQIGSAIAGKPEVAMTHIADREKRADALKKEDNKSDFNLQKLDLMGQRIAMQGELGAARIDAARARSQGGGDDRTRRDDAKDEDNRIKALREKRLTIEKQVDQVMKKVDNRLMTKDEGKAELARLGSLDAKLQKDETTPESRAPTSSINAPSGQAARDSDRAGILNQELAKARQEGNSGDVAALERELGRMKPGLSSARPAAAPAAMPKAKAELKSGQVYQTARGPAKWNGTAFEAQ